MSGIVCLVSGFSCQLPSVSEMSIYFDGDEPNCCSLMSPLSLAQFLYKNQTILPEARCSYKKRECMCHCRSCCRLMVVSRENFECPPVKVWGKGMFLKNWHRKYLFTLLVSSTDRFRLYGYRTIKCYDFDGSLDIYTRDQCHINDLQDPTQAPVIIRFGLYSQRSDIWSVLNRFPIIIWPIKLSWKILNIILHPR